MMLDPVTFDMGCAGSPTFVFSDVSGLAPLTLPDEFLCGQNPRQSEPPSETVRRFEAAMFAEPQISGAVAKSLMARMIPESPKVESPKVEGLEVESSKTEGLKVEGSKVESPKAEGPKVESAKAELPNVEGPK